MAKKIAAPKPQLVHIKSTSADDALLSKAQKEFNRLTSRIAKLEREVITFRDAATRLRQRVQNEYRPLQDRHNELAFGISTRHLQDSSQGVCL